MIRIIHVAGARPNFMKVAPVLAALSRTKGVRQYLVHTGQHYDAALSRIFFDQLSIPRPDIDLGVGSGSHAVQTAGIMTAFERICLEWKPDLVMLVGDVNSTLACSLVAAKLGIPVAHVEAGLRSFDRTMPEEINRMVTDRLSELHFTTEPSANENLLREGVPQERIHFVGNVMIDTLRKHVEESRAMNVPARFCVEPRGYVLVTLHRPSNVDHREALLPVVEALAELAADAPVLFPAHPRTRRRLEAFGLSDRLGDVRLLPPLGYLEFMGLMDAAAVVVTDSGGIQEETTVLGTPCLTLRPNTERPITLTRGTNRLITGEKGVIVTAARKRLRDDSRPAPRIPELWDGEAAERIAAVVLGSFTEDGAWRPSPDASDGESSGSHAVKRQDLLTLHG
jgi:UDP-N-acetylglucosamine 2-epimerase (non-hydrolysing)